MDRRTFNAVSLLALAGCGGDSVQFPLLPTPHLRTSKNIFPGGLDGAWTPTIMFDGVSTGVTYSQQRGMFLKLGRWVTLLGDITLTAKGAAAGTVAVGGIPFKGTNFFGAEPRPAQPIGEWGNLATNWVAIILKMNIVTYDRLTLAGATAASGSIGTDLQNTDLNSNSNFTFCFSYIAEDSA